MHRHYFVATKILKIMFIHKYREKKRKYFCLFRIMLYLCSANDNGAIAQMVEQRTENPCVPGSIPGGTTLKISRNVVTEQVTAFFVFLG